MPANDQDDQAREAERDAEELSQRATAEDRRQLQDQILWAAILAKWEAPQ